MKRQLALYVLVAALAAFGLGLFHLFRLRYEAGDIYPAYSSLRADPLGTMALYEALARLPGLTVQRDFSAQNQLPHGRATTYLHLAASRLDWVTMDEELLREIEGFVSAGGRLVISLEPESVQTFRPSRAAAAPAPPGKKKSSRSSREEQRRLRRTSPEEAWRFEFNRLALPRGEARAYEPVRVTRRIDLPVPHELSWHSPVVCTNLGPAWRTLYARGDAPVLIERKLGSGTIVIATDSYFLSNEALQKEPHADLLAWIVGPSRNIWFDEAHLGMVEQSGVAVLLRKYRLHGLVAGLFLLAGLFIWQNATSFPPPLPAPQRQGPVQGKDAAAGFVNLLRRNIPPADLLRVCFEEWTRSLLHVRSQPISRIDAAQEVLERENARAKTDRDPVNAYKDICAALKGGNPHL